MTRQTNLTARMKIEIADKVAHTVHGPMILAHEATGPALADKIYQAVFSEAEIRHMNQGPADFYLVDDVFIFWSSDAGRVCLKFSQPVRTTQAQGGNLFDMARTKDNKKFDRLKDEVVKWKQKESQLEAERTRFHRQVSQTLASIRTIKQALSIWPTLADLMPEDYFNIESPGVPAIVIEDLDAPLRKAMKKAA